jgi:hypothetical protein
MCPACIASVAWIAAGAASTGGLAALAAIKLGGNKDKAIDSINTIESKQASHESRFTPLLDKWRPICKHRK